MTKQFIKARVEKVCERLFRAQEELKALALLPYGECKEIKHIKNKVAETLIDLQTINMRLRK